MDVRVLHHVSLPVGDLERSRRFYREVLGLEEIARPPFPFPGAWFRLGDRELQTAHRKPFSVRTCSYQTSSRL
ncbi:MAG TPA: VOC family protein [Thermoanaerobaculia bacterium]|nr:VOC family protein [Thermoanaerobaculia bacterium]